MLDVDGHHFIHETIGSHSVLVPQPSDDKHDPLVNYIRSLVFIVVY